ncbi:MAG: DUF2975 domain-containing protein [Pseudomonadota bacterium]
MAIAQTNTVAAVLSQVVLAFYWLAIITLVLGTFVFGVGIAGSMNGGAFKLPLLTAWSEGVPTAQLVMALLETIIFAAALAYVCSELRKVLSTLADGDPFVPDNASRLMRIAVALAIVEVAGIIGVFLMKMVFGLSGTESLRLSVDLAMIGAIIVLWILAQVFKEGTRLREEERMTI